MFYCHTLLFYKNQWNWALGALLLKSSWILGYIALNLFLLFLNFVNISHNTVAIYKTRSRINDSKESQNKKETCFNAHFQYSQSHITELNKTWSLKSLCWSASVELVSIQYNINDNQALFWCFDLFILRTASLDTLFLYSVRQQAWLCS